MKIADVFPPRSGFVQQIVGETPWGQNLLIISKIKDFPAREYYLRMTEEMGWGQNLCSATQNTNDVRGKQKNPQQIRQILNFPAIDDEKIAKENQYLLFDDINL